MVTYITVPDMNDSFSRIVLENREYRIRFTYNGAGDYWTFGIYNTEENCILQRRKIVPVSPINHFDTGVDMPPGLFGCFTKLKKVGRNDFNNGNAQFAYIPWEELKEWRVKNGIVR